VFILERLQNEFVIEIIKRSLADKERGLGGKSVSLTDSVIEYIAEIAAGDARVALNALELSVTIQSQKKKKGEKGIVITEKDIREALQRTHVIFDKKGEEFYNLISALHKSMRGSDANASLYWLARMLEGGADPLYIARRVLRFASEDIGMANSEAMIQANAVYDAVHKIGMPECTVHLAQAVVYCAKSKKSNALYRAYGAAATDAKNTSHLGVPIHLRNAPTKLMKDIGYGKEYKYNPAYKEPVDQEYLPGELKGRDYFN
jgi:putative ATPase